MVSYADVQNNNASLSSSGSGLIAVLVGATSGIGLATFHSLVAHTTSPTIYLVGRSHSRLQTLITDAQTANAGATIHPIIAKDLTLVKDAQTAANAISSSPGIQKIDLLIMSPGYISSTREETSEGLDACTSIRFYARMRFLVTLAPLLRAAPSPRVITVLGSGRESTLDPDDLLLQKNYSLLSAAGASASLNTLFLEEFAKKEGNETISFIHLYPGFVKGTGIEFRGMSWYFQLLVDWLVLPLAGLFGYSSQEAGERVVFAGTNGRYRRLKGGSSGVGTLVEQGSDGKVGGGVYLVQGDSSVVVGNKALQEMREKGVDEKVYEHTIEVLERGRA